MKGTILTHNIYLIGPRASGKTTLARLLAREMSRGTVDTDALLVERVGESIADFVARKGWDAFRDEESHALKEAAELRGRVVATGGGIILRENNRNILRETGTVFYLKAAPETLLARLRKAPLPGQRPALTDKSEEEEMLHVLEQREPLYQECAHHVISGETPLQTTVHNILDCLERTHLQT